MPDTAPESATERIGSMRRVLEEARATAIVDPTSENVAAYLRLQQDNLEGYLKFPGPFPVASIRLNYVERPSAAERFVARAGDRTDAHALGGDGDGTNGEDITEAPENWSGQGELFEDPPLGGEDKASDAEAAVMDVLSPESVPDEGGPEGAEESESETGEARASAGTPAPSGKRKHGSGADTEAPKTPRPSPNWV